MRRSLSGGWITPQLPVNVFLITCFYWKPRFPELRARPDWARPVSTEPNAVQEYDYHAGPTAATLGTTRTCVSDLGVCPVLSWQREAVPWPVECVRCHPGDSYYDWAGLVSGSPFLWDQHPEKGHMFVPGSSELSQACWKMII